MELNGKIMKNSSQYSEGVCVQREVKRGRGEGGGTSGWITRLMRLVVKEEREKERG